MSDIKFWDPIDANNTSAPPDGWPEGQPASTVNDCARAMMGAIRRQWQDAAWFDWDDTITYVAANQFNVVGDGTVSDRYTIGRRVRAQGAITGTIYGTITDTGGNFVVTVTWDSGGLASETLAVALGAPSAGPAISAAAIVVGATVPVGSIIMHGVTVPPDGFLYCNGAAFDSVANPQYAPLFNVIGTTWGGTGADDFSVPDLRGRAPVCYGSGTGLTTRALAAEWGEERHTLTLSEMALHTHAYNGQSIEVQAGTGVSVFGSATERNTTAQGADTPFNVIGPSVGVNFMIRY